MKTKIYVSLLFIALIVTGPMNAQNVITTKPSIEGRASVADEGVLPKGLYAKSSLFLPGDSVSITNPATGITLNVMILGSAESSDGTAILLSPEAAVRLFIAKGTETLVSMTKKAPPPDPSSSAAPFRRTVDPDRHPEDAIPSSLGAKLADASRPPVTKDPPVSADAKSIPDNELAKTPNVRSAPYNESGKTDDVKLAPYGESGKASNVQSAPVREPIKTVENYPAPIEDHPAPLNDSAGNDDVRTVPYRDPGKTAGVWVDPYRDPTKTTDVPSAPVREPTKTVENYPVPNDSAGNDDMSFIPVRTAEDRPASLNNSGRDEVIPEPVRGPVTPPEARPSSSGNSAKIDDLRRAPYTDLTKTDNVRSVPYNDPGKAPDMWSAPYNELAKSDDVRRAPYIDPGTTADLQSVPGREAAGTVEKSPAPSNNSGRDEVIPEPVRGPVTPPEARPSSSNNSAKIDDLRRAPYKDPAKTPDVQTSSSRAPVKAPGPGSSKIDAGGEELTVVDFNPASPNPPPQSPMPDPPIFTPIPNRDGSTPQPPSSVTPRLNELVVLENNLTRGFYYVQIATMSDERNIDFLLSKYRDRYNFALVPSRANTAAYRVMVGPLTADEYGVVLSRFQGSGYGDAFVKKIQ